MKEAKANRETNAKLAADKMRSYKYYKQELDVLYSRKAAKQKPPLFHWQTDVREVVVENLDIGEDQFKLSIDGAYDLEGALDGHSSRSISISYLTGLLKEESKVVVGPANYTEGKVLFSYEIIVNGLKRSKNARILYGRKKATFELTLNRGFFRSSVDFARSEIALEELLSKSECGGVLPLYGISKDGKKSKAVGGSLKVTIKLRSPLAGRELRKITDRTLIVEEWPIGENFLDQQKVELEKANEKFGVADAPQPIIQKEQSKSPLTEQEIHDPHAVDFLESNEVLEAEIRIVSSALQTSDLDEDSKFEASMRLQLLQTKLQILTLSVQQERISFEEYLDMLRVRIVRDKEMAIYFKNRKEDPVNLQHALRIMRRIKLMEEELKEAEESV